MKILFFINDLRSGGKERRLVELIKGLSNFSEIEMEIVLTKDGIHYSDIYASNIKIHYLLRKKGKKDLTLFYKFFKIAKHFKPDILHVWENLVTIYAIPIKIFLRVPMINNQITNSTIQKAYSISSHRLTFLFSDKIIANTYAGLKAYNAPKNKSLVIYNGFDFNRVANLEEKSIIRKKFNIQTKFVVGMVATFSKKKDYQTYIKAANKVLEKERDVTFLCVGDGDSNEFKEMVHKNNKEKILFLGKKSKVEPIMNICDLGVLMTNPKHGEGISNAILEFNALDKPVIASLGGGTSEIIEDEVSGFLIKPEHPDQLSNKIIYLLENDKERYQFGRNAKEIVGNRFSISKMIDEFREVYQNITN